MGNFLAVSAVKGEDITAVCQAIADYCKEYRVECRLQEQATEPNEQTDATIYNPHHGWIRILWPAYFNIHDFSLARKLSAEKSWDVSTVHVYDDDFWEHLFVSNGNVLHRFSSWPDYFAKTPEERVQAKTEWKGDSAALAAHLGVSGNLISRYLVHMPIAPTAHPTHPSKRSIFSIFRKKAPEAQPPAKAYDDDEFEIENFWVFTDFWRRLGIVYPDPPGANIAKVLRLGANFGRKLPSE